MIEGNNLWRLDAPARGCAAPVQSGRRTLRNYYAAIRMGLTNRADNELGLRSLDALIADNESKIAEEEAQPNDQAHAPAKGKL